MSTPVPIRSPLPTALAGQNVLIVGGSSGIGLAAARLLGAAGAGLLLVARDETRLKEAADSLADATPVRTLAADVTDESALAQAFERAGPLDHVLLTAGAAARAPLAEADRSRVQGDFDVRFWGGYATARAAAERLPAGGSITFMSGVYTVRPVAGAAAAIASGAACEGLARALAVELAPRRVRVNAVRAGIVDTPPLRRRLGAAAQASDAQADAVVAAAGRHLPLGRFGTAEEAAAAAVFVMANPYVTGSVVTVDGGQSLA
ncbi:SDR family oxidoreductase [Streptomyces sp. NBC_01275]|uniref:SDR family oxidoreductase n=1 Tax=Streptomyces sp. NBC_01275 TaxID=2903807 RepID=UPI0022586430|nr:SDR family oxidoreductase [Streptomyces sp. NBC_01275]MCX4761523.1 SDR family oxidoreductase [Streptomyces sp. NBC_01275]